MLPETNSLTASKFPLCCNIRLRDGLRIRTFYIFQVGGCFIAGPPSDPPNLRVQCTGMSIRIGTSAFTASGWEHSFYPDGMKPADYLSFYATRFNSVVECDAEFKEFVQTMDLLGDKLGPLLLQFGYFYKKAFVAVNDFLARLKPFLKKLPKNHKFAVEIRNKNW